jgi:YHS domain-containing protein/thiol-disulfide isomerase/thioredoxin
MKFFCTRFVWLVLLLSVPLTSVRAETGSEAWRHNFEQAEAEARQRGLPILVHFHAKWCGPCRKMDQMVLNDPQVVRQLRAGVVAVKVDNDERPDLVKRFHVDMLPADLFLDPKGFVLDRFTGERDRQTYVSQVARVESRFAQSRATQIASQQRQDPPMDGGFAPLPIAPDPVVQRPRSFYREQLADRPRIASPSSQIESGTVNPSNGVSRNLVGLRGYSPVALVRTRRWVRGNAAFPGEYKGIWYYLTSAEELRGFQANPDQFAPQVLGCDPVILDITDRAVRGDVHFAVFFDGQLYLFVSEKSRQVFKQDPDRFVRTKHVLNVDELDDRRLE